MNGGRYGAIAIILLTKKFYSMCLLASAIGSVDADDKFVKGMDVIQEICPAYTRALRSKDQLINIFGNDLILRSFAKCNHL
jgi:hypothetical protein